MGYHIEFRTSHEDNGKAIEHLASQVQEKSLTLSSKENIPQGSWVAFEVKLADGTVFFEGMGRCESKVALGTSFEVQLGSLQLDPRNEFVFERVLLARDDIEAGARVTGTVDLSQLTGTETKPKQARPTQARPTSGTKPPPLRPSSKPGPPSKPVSKPPPPLRVDLKKSELPSRQTPNGWFEGEKTIVAKISMSDAEQGMLLEELVTTELHERLLVIVPRLVAEGRVRDRNGVLKLALRIGLQALETFLEDE